MSDADLRLIVPPHLEAGTYLHIPATMAFNVISSINDELTKYEQEFGEVRRPGELPGAP